MGQSRIGIDVEFPAAQVGTRVRLLDDLAVTVVGIGHIHGLIGAVGDLYGFHAVIGDPVVDAGADFLHIVSTGFQASDRDFTVGRGCKGRTGNGFGACSVSIDAKHPAIQVITGIGCLLDRQATRDLLINRCDGDRVIRGVLIESHGPLGGTAWAVASGKHGFSYLVGTEGQLAGLGITAGIGGTDVEYIAGCLIHSLELGTGQVIAVGVLLVDFNETSLIDDVIDVQVIPGTGAGALGTGIGHVLYGTDLRAAGVTDVDNEMILTAVGAAGIVEIIGAGIYGCVGQVTIRIGEDDNVAGDQIGIGSGCVGILGNTAACLGCQIVQARGPAPHRCSGVAAIVHGGSFDRLMNVVGIDALNVRQVVIDEVAYKGSTHQTLLFELGDIRSLTGNGGAVSNSFITVKERAVIVIADIGQDIRIRAVDITGNILGNIQIAVVF